MQDEFVRVEKYQWGSPLAWHRVSWDGPVFKYVDVEHAAAVSSGSTKIGTIWGFRQMEGAKRDVGENTIPFRFGLNDELDGRNPRDSALLQSIGLDIDGDVKIAMRGATVNLVGQDYYACCFAKNSNLPHLQAEKKQAIFQINDIKAWVRRICEIFDVLGPCFVREVSYQDRRALRFEGGVAMPNPFIKPGGFCGEQEVRVVWLANQSTPMGRYPPLDLVSSDPIIAALLRRVR